MRGKLCVVTGANSGVGFEAARGLARAGANVILVCRSPSRGEAALERIRRESSDSRLLLKIADLSALTQVRRLAKELAEEFERIDVLVNNAGVYRARLEITEDGFERTMAVNHLAHFLLTLDLIELLTRSKARVINVSSEAHRAGKLRRRPLEEILRGRGRYSGWQAYADSKLANVLFTNELARRFASQELTAVAVHPGTLATRIWNQNANLASLLLRLFKPLMGRPLVGGEAILFVAQQPGETVGGAYFNRIRKADPATAAQDTALATDLWNLSVQLTEVAMQQ